MLTINGIDSLRTKVGDELGTSAWHTVTQEHINAFASATDDYEELHLNPERAAETPWGVTIAHGLYTLSLGPKFTYEILRMTGISYPLNYGFEKVRFTSPVPEGSQVRMTLRLLSADDIAGGTKFRFEQRFEIRGRDKPACVAEAVFAYFH
ncbi:MaoC family dehydratase [Nocardioides sp. YJ-D4]